MSKMSEMDMNVQMVVAYVDAGEEVADAIEAVRMSEGLENGEYRNLIHYVNEYYKQERG